MTAAGEYCNFQASYVTAAKLRGHGTSPRSELTNCAMRLSAAYVNNCADWKFLIYAAQFRKLTNCTEHIHYM